MDTIKIEVCENDVSVSCPNCDNWEVTGVDDPRKRFTSIPLVNFTEDSEEGWELSVNECSECKTMFYVEWDYNNIYSEN